MTNPLPSWSDAGAKAAIVDFVERVTKQGGADYVPAADRIATFDNDGTLWCEQPIQVQLFFAMDRLKALATEDPSLREKQPFKAFLERDLKTIGALGKKGAIEFAMKTHAGMSADAFDRVASDWLATAKHPQLGRRFIDNVYQPQVELLGYLRDNGFGTFIVSGGGVDLIRGFAEEKYGIRRDQVIGSAVKSKFSAEGDRPQVMKLPELDTFDDREVKPENIYLHIGRRPILAFGNSDGDLAMMRYAKGHGHPSLALLLHHDDDDREFAYDRDFKLSPLADALDNAEKYGITVVSMKRDWTRVFAA